MRTQFSIVFLCLILALTTCAVIAHRSRKPIAKSLTMLLIALIFPVMGNLIIVFTGQELFAKIGCYIYYLGMDGLMFTMMQFMYDYCRIPRRMKKLRMSIYAFLIADVVQLLLNPLFHHAFQNEVIMVDDFPYYGLVPLAGQYFHRIVDYSILFAILLVFFVRMVRSPKVHSERYSVIFYTLFVAAIWQSLYIFSGSPIDRSMIGFGVFGLMIFYFSLYYRPLRLLDQMLAKIASEMPEALFFYDIGAHCIWANKPAKQLIDIDEDEYELAWTRLTEKFGTPPESDDEWTIRRVIGEGENERHFVITRHKVTDEKESLAGFFISFRDNTEEEQRLRREIYNATHDSLTGLFTREYLYEQIKAQLEQHPEAHFQIVFLDVNNFKIVNDIFSNAFGDYALKCIANWIRRDAQKHWVYGRLGGDTFGVCMPVSDFEPARIEEELSKFVVRDKKVDYHLLMHLGIYEINDTDTDIAVMFDRAHLALQSIKDEYQTHIAYYDEKLRKQVLWEQHISAQLREAIDERQLRPYLQPIVDANGKLIGAEALARWIHPTDGFLSPALFIPVFEKNGMIVEVDKHMWRCACEILARWAKKDLDFFISVNISPKDFYFMDVAGEIGKLVKEFDIEPSKLRLEITETVMMNNSEERMKILSGFRAAGFIVEMDDFGSGYSSLNMLKDMPVDVIKIDMKFLNRTQNDSRAKTIMQNIMQLSDDLGLISLTEGVETQEQFEMLTNMRCKMFQGYYFNKPMPVGDFEKNCMS